MSKCIALLGATGLLGSTLGPYLKMHGHSVVGHSRSEGAQFQADISTPADAFNLLNSISPSVIVNLVALTDVDTCETEPDRAHLFNVRTVENIARWIRQRKQECHLIHVSTDQVYDGAGPHSEDAVKLTNQYAVSKYAGELAAATVPSTILRTNFVGCSYCSKRSSFTDWIYRSLSNRHQIQVFGDVLFSPLGILTLSRMICLCIDQRPPGLFNLGSREGMSKADFAFAFAARLDLPTSLMTRVSSDVSTSLKAYRPKDMRMNCARIEGTLGIELPVLAREIEVVAEEYHDHA